MLSRWVGGLVWALTAWLLLVPVRVGAQEQPLSADEEHEQLFLENRFPSATTCGNCHPTQYRQWSVSPHSYAQMSPVFNAMHGAVLKLTNGTNGDFCIRCHTPVGMNLGEPEFMSNMDRNATSREGVTCIVCHRLNKAYGSRLLIGEQAWQGLLLPPVLENWVLKLKISVSRTVRAGHTVLQPRVASMLRKTIPMTAIVFTAFFMIPLKEVIIVRERPMFTVWPK
jgi:hypothetical protein